MLKRMMKSHIYTVAIGLCAMTLLSCNNGKKQLDGPVTDGEELALAISQTEEGGVVNLAPGATINLTGPVTVNKSLTIAGDESSPAKIKLGKGGFVISKNFKLANAEIDASDNKTAFILFAKEPVVDELNGTDYYGIEDVSLENLIIKDVKSNLIYDNNIKYCVVSLSIDNCLIALKTEDVRYESIITFEAGGVKDLTIQNTTMHGNMPDIEFFVRYNNGARLDRYGFDTAVDYQSMTYENNTFVDLLKPEGQWGNYNAFGGQNYSRFIVKGNIWKNCGQNIVRRLIGGRYGDRTVYEFADNTYWGQEGEQDESKFDTSGTQLKTDPAFKDAPKNFQPTGAEQVAKHTGDPRWF